MPEKNETNKVRLIGEVISEFTFNHEVFGEILFREFVSCSFERTGGCDSGFDFGETHGCIQRLPRHDDGSNWTVPLL